MKKLISCILILVMLLSTVVFGAPSEEQLKDLRDYKIMVGDDDGEMRLGDTITRAEAAKMICVIYGLSVDSFADNVEPSAFADVPDTHWAKNYINCVKGLMIAEGDENGNFNPEATITNEEIIKMLVVALGYNPMADQTGGYPMGYTRTAQKIGITSDLMLEVDVPAIRGDVALMFATSLDIPVMVQTSWSTDGSTSYAILDGSAGTEKKTLRIMNFEK